MSKIHEAARTGDVAKISQLLRKSWWPLRGANVNQKDPNDEYKTPLHVAAQHGHYEAATLLIEHGSGIDLELSLGETPLFLAVENGHLELVKLLVEHGANVNCKTYGSQTPLLMASSENNCDIAELLLEHGADVNCQDKDGNTPLHRANKVVVADGGHQLTKLLLQHAADVKCSNKKGETPLHLAAELFSRVPHPVIWTRLCVMPLLVVGTDFRSAAGLPAAS